MQEEKAERVRTGQFTQELLWEGGDAGKHKRKTKGQTKVRRKSNKAVRQRPVREYKVTNRRKSANYSPLCGSRREGYVSATPSGEKKKREVNITQEAVREKGKMGGPK